MAYSFERVIEQEVQNFLDDIGIKSEALPQRIMEQISGGSVYAEFAAGDSRDRRLVLFRLTSLVTMREEVFLGSVLLNSFLSKNVLLACQINCLGDIAMVANDLENFYYLWYGSDTLDKLVEAYRKQLETNLMDFYLGPQDEIKGIYGDIHKLFEFHKNNIEAFPIFAMPKAFVPALGNMARRLIMRRINDFDFDSKANPTIITANMAFFLSRQGSDFQSPYLLIVRMAGKYAYDTGISVQELSVAFNISSSYDLSTKSGENECSKSIKDSLGKGKYSPAHTKALFTKIINVCDSLAHTNPGEWDMKYARDKALNLSSSEMIDELLGQSQLGYMMIGKRRTGKSDVYCRCCGADSAQLIENHIIMGEDVGKFHNQFVNADIDQNTKICIKCCVQSFLGLKITGNIAGSLAFVPKQSGMVFHYGKHTDADIDSIATSLKKIFDLVRERKANRKELYELRKKKQELEQKIEKTKAAAKKGELQNQLGETDKMMQEATQGLATYAEQIKRELGYEIDPDTDPAIDIFTDADIDIDIPENYVFGIGLGDYRLMAFVLPEIRNYDNKKAHDFVQQKFNNSRITIVTVLAFLRKLCGCDGPYYYMMLPALYEGNFSGNTFYVRDKEYNAEEVMEYFELFAEFSRGVIKRSKDNNLVKKMLLAGRMLDDPLVTLSEVMRHSQVLSRDNEDKYHTLFDPESRRPDLNKYLYLYTKSRDFISNKEMK